MIRFCAIDYLYNIQGRGHVLSVLKWGGHASCGKLQIAHLYYKNFTKFYAIAQNGNTVSEYSKDQK